MEPTKKIYAALAGVMSDLRQLGKTERNQMQNYNYRGIDQLMNTAHASLDIHKVIILPRVLNEPIIELGPMSKAGHQMYRSLIKIEYIFLSTVDGTSVTSGPFIGEGLDTSDKATNKAQTAAYKWCFFQTFCIPTDGSMADSERGNLLDQDEATKRTEQQSPEQTAEGETDAERDARHVKELAAIITQITGGDIESGKNLLKKWTEFPGDKGPVFIDTLRDPRLKGKWLNRIIVTARAEYQEWLKAKGEGMGTTPEEQEQMGSMKGKAK